MKLLLFATVLVFTSGAYSQIYSIDTTLSRVEWQAGKRVGGSHNGEIQIKNGQLHVDKNNQITSAQINIDMGTITNIDLKDSPEFQKKLVAHLSDDDFFKVNKFPESQFKLKSLKQKKGSKDQYTVTGELTMIGVTKPIEFPAQIRFENGKVIGSATVKIERLKWGLQYGSGSIFKTLTADKIINDTFDLNISIIASK